MIVEFIIPTYDRIAPLESMLTSLLAQTNSNWKAHVIIDSVEEMPAEKIVVMLKDSRIRFSYTGKRHNNWGHTPREIGKQASDADYVVMTGDDNYYCPTCVNDILIAAKQNPGMIYWDMVHSHYNYTYFKCSPYFNQIDMGAFATRIDLAKQVELHTTYAADGEFVEEFKSRFSNETIMKIDKILFVHN
jgi:glycosyltransferase involved in cell wall biosynthesis